MTAADARRGADLADLPATQNTRQSKYSAHFLPAFDEYLVAYKDREQGELGPAVIVNGRIAGTWKRTKDKVIFNPSRALNKLDRVAIASAADRYLSFVDLPVQFVY